MDPTLNFNAMYKHKHQIRTYHRVLCATKRVHAHPTLDEFMPKKMNYYLSERGIDKYKMEKAKANGCRTNKEIVDYWKPYKKSKFSYGTPMVTYNFVLRPDCEVQITLPVDVSKTELDRLSKTVKNYHFDNFGGE